MVVETNVRYRVIIGEDLGINLTWTGCVRAGESGEEYLFTTEDGSQVVVTSSMLDDLVKVL